MEMGETLYVKTRKEWRSWLSKHHTTVSEIWLVYYKKGSGRKRIPYDHAVEEALCYGWIDGIAKSIDEDSYAQRFTPRRLKSSLSELNRERVRRLIRAKKMTKYGLERLGTNFDVARDMAAIVDWEAPRDILARLRSDAVVWKNYRAFPEAYRRIRVMWIDAARSRPEEFEKRLAYFMRKTARNEKYGSLQR